MKIVDLEQDFLLFQTQELWFSKENNGGKVETKEKSLSNSFLNKGDK